MVLKPFLTAAAFAVPVAATFFDVVGYVANVDGLSMQPTFNPKRSKKQDAVWLNKWCVHKHQYHRGEIISLVSPQDPEELLIKRIIAIPGDDVETLSYKNRYVTIPPGHLWVEGDNHVNSKDSNQFGPVAMGLVHSKAQYIVWPPRRWQHLKKEVPRHRLNKPAWVEPQHLTHRREELPELESNHLFVVKDSGTEVYTEKSHSS